MTTLRNSSLALATVAAALSCFFVLARADDKPPTAEKPPPVGEKPAGDKPAAPHTPKAGHFTLLHTNDWHGYALPQVAKPRKGSRGTPPPRGGLAAAAAVMEAVRTEVGAANVLALDAGDLLTGHPSSTLSEDGVLGATFVKAWSGLPLDAWVVGNHDFDGGRKNAEALVKLARPTMLCANLVKADDGKLVFPGEGYKVFERGGLKIGVIGLVTADLARLASAETVVGLKILPLAEAARPIALKLEQECDLVVAVTHAGLDSDRALAKAVPQIDVIVGGHDHKRLTKAATEGGCVILQAGCNGREVGRADIHVANGRVALVEARLVNALATSASPNAIMAEPLAKIEKFMAGLDGEVLGEVTRRLTRGNYYQEHACGSFVAEAIKAAAKVDVGLINSGGVRDEFEQGKVSRADLLRVLPNDGKLEAFDVTGAELEQICLHNAKAAVSEDHGVLQVAGLRYKWKREGEGKTGTATVLSVEVGGKPLEKEKTYTCASNDFIVDEQAVKYFGFKPAKIKPVEMTMHQAVVAAFKKGPIEMPDRGRMFEEGRKQRGPKPDEKPGEKPGEKGGGDEKEPAGAGAGKGEPRGEKGDKGGGDGDGE